MEVEYKIMEQMKIDDRRNDFLNMIDSFFNQLKFGKSYPDTINLGLNVLFNIPGALYTAFFSFDTDNLDFQHTKTVPISFKDASKLAFRRFVDTVEFGESIQKGKIIFIDDIVTDSNDLAYLLVPFLSRIGFEGVGILLLDKDNFEMSSFDIKLIQLFASSFSNIISSYKLEQKLASSASLLEQKVASRTLALEHSKREIKAIIDFVQTAILIINIDSQIITSLNPAAEKLLGARQEEIVGKRYDIFLIDEVKRETTNSEELTNFESKLRRANGESLDIFRSFAIMNLGAVKYRVESFLNITEEKAAQKLLLNTNEILELKVKERTEELEILVQKLRNAIHEKENLADDIQKALEKEKELNELKSRFVTMVSHEFRTPLTVISSAAQLIQNFYDKLEEKEKQDYLNRIIKSVDVLKDTLENALFIGKSDFDDSVYISLLNIGELCRHIVDTVVISFENARQINYNFSGEFQNAYTDERLIRHIFVNLLSNAIKYSPNGREVDFTVKHFGNKIEFIVRDYGIGICAKDRDELFTIFHRGQNVGSISGSGIGLAVVKKSIDALNGEINIESELGRGTTFTVIIKNRNELFDEAK